MAVGTRAQNPVGPPRHPYLTELAALLLAGAVAAVVARSAGLHAVGRVFEHRRPIWLLPEFVVQFLGILAYASAYRGVVRQLEDRRLTLGRSFQLVVTGFGPLSLGGGFASDERSLQRMGFTRGEATRTVFMLSGVELLSLVWIAFGAAVLGLIIDPRLKAVLVWPWLILVPIGTAIAVETLRRQNATRRSGTRPVVRALRAGLRDVLALARHPRRFGIGWPGIVAYWLLDMAALGFALRAFGVTTAPEALILAYGTGYLVSRRTLPLGGAGFVELLMTFSLYWIHVPLADAISAVILYRGLDLGVTALRAAVARARLESALAADQRNAA